MKRYRVTHDLEMEEVPDGEWVWYEDVEKLEHENRSYKELIKSFYIVTNSMLERNAKLEEVLKVVADGVCKNTECAEIIKQLKTEEEENLQSG